MGASPLPRAAAGAGKRCALRLWNLDGAETEGANRQNGQILSRLREAFPGPWRSDRRGTTLAPGIYLEFGEKFQWPDLSAPEEEGRRFCYGLRDQVGVLWDGTVVPCCLDHEGDVPLGNLYETSLEEILSGPRAAAHLSWLFPGGGPGRPCAGGAPLPEDFSERCKRRRSGVQPLRRWELEGTMEFSQWKERYSLSLDEQQEQAVQAVDGPVLLLAVPGSGKTTVGVPGGLICVWPGGSRRSRS